MIAPLPPDIRPLAASAAPGPQTPPHWSEAGTAYHDAAGQPLVIPTPGSPDFKTWLDATLADMMANLGLTGPLLEFNPEL